MTTLTHPTLIDPATGEPLEAIGFRASGAPIWPMIGGAEDLDKPGLPDGVDDSDDDSDDSGEPDPAEGGDTKPKAKPGKADDSDDSDDDADDDIETDGEGNPKDLAAARKLRRENKSLREKLAKAELSKAEREELEKLRDEKRTDTEKLEHRAKAGEESAAELRAQLDETKIRLALGLPEPDGDDEDEDDPFVDIPIKGDSLEEKLASARRFAKKYGIGRFAKASDEPTEGTKRKTPPAKNLRGQRGTDDDPEDDPMKLAARVKSNTFGLH